MRHPLPYHCAESRASSGKTRRRGGILIVVLWTLLFLASLAAAVAAYVGGQVEAARRLEGRALARQAARGGIEHGIALLMRETNGWESLNEPWANNPDAFRDITSGVRTSWTAYYLMERSDGSVATNYGLSDEQGRIDLNYARVDVLAALFRVAGGYGPEKAEELATTIVDARTPLPPGQRRPASARPAWVPGDIENGPFLSVHELLWIRGMSRELFDAIAPFITVHGGTRVNLNSAGAVVLRVLIATRDREGADDLIRKILQFRDGGGIFKTLAGSGLAGSGGDEPGLSAEDQAMLGGLAPYVTVTSDRFRGYVEAGKGAGQVGISFVWDRRERRFLYWHED